MKKKILSLVLALALCLGLAVPALADDYGQPRITYAPGQPTEWNSPTAIAPDGSPWMIGFQDDDDLITCDVDEYGEATYTVREGSTIQVAQNPDWDGTIFDLSYYGEYDEFPYYSTLWAEDPQMEPITIQFDHGIVNPQTGEKVVADVYDFTSGVEWDDGMGCNMHFYVKIVSNGTAPVTPTVAPVDAQPKVAYPSSQMVEINGKGFYFECYALKDANGNDTNYIKLRDLANILSVTAARFDVGWNGAVTITTGKTYTRIDTDRTPFNDQRPYQEAAAPTLIDGQQAALAAIVLTDDNGGGYTYYKLRDLGEALGFTVDWSAERGIYVETPDYDGSPNWMTNAMMEATINAYTPPETQDREIPDGWIDENPRTPPPELLEELERQNSGSSQSEDFDFEEHNKRIEEEVGKWDARYLEVGLSAEEARKQGFIVYD